MNLLFLGILWGIPACGALAVSLPIILLGGHRVRWRVWELLAFVLPYGVWFFAQYYFPAPQAKGWGNLIEPFYLSVAIPIAALVRVWIGKRFNETCCAAGLLGGLCLVAALVNYFTPFIGSRSVC